MKKEMMTRLLSIIVSIAMSVGCFSIISTADEYEKYQPSAKTRQLINAVYQELGMSEAQIREMSSSSQNTLYYAYVNANGLNVGYDNNYDLDYYVSLSSSPIKPS